MRYYLYLDKEFLKWIVASIPGISYDIEIMEFSIQKGETLTKDINIAPNANEMTGQATWQKNDTDCEDEKSNKNECRKQVTGGLTFFAGEKNTYNTVVERRYINIEDVTGIKNLTFFNNLILKLENMCSDENNLCMEHGNIYPCKLKNTIEGIDEKQYPQNNQFFCINNKYVWIDNNNLVTDLLFLSTITSNVTVIGFSINKVNNVEIIKAIAIYI